ncbi:MAG: ATP-binding cassette domain-containing protein [Bacteroidota bacterium]|nr:ATP-binding cassette domain-containing protein [Bacteroidota bacterium]
MIDVQSINFSYRKDEKTIDDLSFHVPAGSVYGFLGANGSGKTTTIRLLVGLCAAKSGLITIGGEKIDRNSVNAFHKIGSLIESPSFYGHLTAEENLHIHTLYHGLTTDRIDPVLAMVGLEYAAKKRAGLFSLGMKQRLGLALCLLHDPELLILDEPLNGLDPKGIAEIRELLLRMQRDEGKTIFISSHILSEIENVCNEICIIDKGKKLFSGSIEALRRTIVKKYTYRVACDQPEEASVLLGQSLPVEISPEADGLRFLTDDRCIVPEVIRLLTEKNVRLYEVTPVENNLEELYLKLTNL